MSKIYTVKMPDIGEGVVEGEVIEWLKKINDPVKQDEPVLIVMTDKATVELPSPQPGILVKQYYEPGQIATRDLPLYDIEITDGSTSKKEVEKEVKIHVPKEKSLSEEKIVPSTKLTKQKSNTATDRALASPPVRKIAHDLDVDIDLVKGTGKEGHVTIEDLKTFIRSEKKHTSVSSSALTHLPGDEEVPIVGIRNLMAKKMKESKQEIPHFSYFEEVDATRLVQLRQKFKEGGAKEGIQVTYMPFLIKALSLTISHYPQINSRLDTETNKLIIHKQQNIGIAISTELGLIVPVLSNVQELSLRDLIKGYEDLKEKGIKGKLHPNDMKDATITISNFGVLGGGGLWATPIINFPEVAILAVARIQKQPLVKNDVLVARDALNLSWSFDHRVIDGDLAASVSHYFSTLIHNPAQLL